MQENVFRGAGLSPTLFSVGDECCMLVDCSHFKLSLVQQ